MVEDSNFLLVQLIDTVPNILYKVQLNFYRASQDGHFGPVVQTWFKFEPGLTVVGFQGC